MMTLESPADNAAAPAPTGRAASPAPAGRAAAPAPTGRAWIEVDLAKLRCNAELLRRRLPLGCRLMPAVKADAYGLGAVPIACELSRLGIDAFCVASVAEAVELREAGIGAEILILGYTDIRDFALLQPYNLTQTAVDADHAAQLNAYAATQGIRLPVHLKVDTGMHRLGIDMHDIEAIMHALALPNLAFTGVYTHLGAVDCNDGEAESLTRQQIESFQQLVTCLQARGYTYLGYHMLSSYGVVRYPELAYGYARVGIAMYGLLSQRDPAGSPSIGLQSIASVQARIAAVKAIQTGDWVGYGMAFQASRDMRIAVVAIGYADGVPRALSCSSAPACPPTSSRTPTPASPLGYLLVKGRRAPIVGRVCMDQLMIDVTAIEGVTAGDVAVLIGESGGSEVTAYDLAEQAGTITNEILSRLGSRLERVFLSALV